MLGRTAEVVVTPGNPGIPGSVVDAAGGARRRPVRHRAGAASWSTGWPTGCGRPGRLVFGPGADGAQLEGSKAFMKELVSAARACPRPATAPSPRWSPPSTFLRSLPPPYVVKTDGLAAGKGVLVTHDLAEAEADVRDKLSGASFGDGGSDGRHRRGHDRPRGVGVRHLRRHPGRGPGPGPGLQAGRPTATRGPNTGGMGAYSPAAVARPPTSPTTS